MMMMTMAMFMIMMILIIVTVIIVRIMVLEILLLVLVANGKGFQKIGATRLNAWFRRVKQLPFEKFMKMVKKNEEKDWF